MTPPMDERARAAGLLPHPDNPAQPDSVVVMVHGTYQPDAAWTLPASKLSARLRETLPGAGLYRFQWSGANSHHARRNAGAALGRAMVALNSSHVSAITHSHGGNVLMYALTSAHAHVQSAVCLATPFLYVRDARLLLTRWHWYFFSVGWPAGVVALLVAGIFAWRAGFYPAAVLLHLWWTVVVALLAACLVSLLRYRREHPAWRVPLPHLPQEKLLLLRPVGDEAAGALGSAHMASLVLRAIWGIVARLGQRGIGGLSGGIVIALLVGFLAQTLGLPGADMIATGLTAVLELFFWLFLAGIFAAGAVIATVAGVMAGCQLVFGFDSAGLALSAITSVEDSPPGRQTVRQFALDSIPGGRGLDHSRLYDEDGVIAEIVEFLRGGGQTTVPDSPGAREP